MLTEPQLRQAMLADRHRLRRLMREVARARQAGKPADRSERKLQRWWEESSAKLSRRQQNRPTVQLDPTLPISQRSQEIAEAIQQHSVVVICGETGSGKSTQLPKICMQLGRGVEGMIGHTQPRRLAARSISQRLCDELGGASHAAFKVRFTDTVGPLTAVKLMTDGVLLAETQSDRFLNQYDTIIVDEAHERSLNIDFLLGYLKRLLQKRRDLRVIITSATIDVDRFSQHFAVDGKPAPVVEVSGRVYPVEVRYRPLLSEDGEQEADLQESIFQAVKELTREGSGDILTFLPTEREIRETAKHLRSRLAKSSPSGGVEILPLYARLSAAEQQRIFQTHPGRRIVLATNVAESSLTVPGIRYTIDTGTARMSRYATKSQVQRLPVESISRASADQRKGRCGRLGPGVCIRLYSEDDFLARDAFTTPEIRRTNLAAVILQTHALQLGDVEEFPFLDPPHRDAIRDGYRTLTEISAIDSHRQLTDLGKRLSRLPVDPRIGRMILAADEQHCLHDMLVIAAVLEIQDPRDRPLEHTKAADEAHAQFAHAESDFLTLLKMWDLVHHLKATLSRSQFRKALRQNFLSFNRVAEWLDLVRQLRQVVIESGLKVGPAGAKYDELHQALLTGLLSNIAYRGGDFEYTGAGGGKFHLWPGSGVFGTKPKWVVAAELVETSKRYLRTVARIDPAWLEPLAPHLVKRSYSDPHWSSKSGAVMAHERVTLFGLLVVAGRRVPYGPIDPEACRDLFIEHALVQQDMRFQPQFLAYNQQLREDVSQMAAKARNRHLLVDDHAISAFYQRQLPEQILSVQDLKQWLRLPEARDGAVLEMDVSDLLEQADEPVAADAFPDQVRVAEMKLNLQYAYQPGDRDDGVTVTIPKEGLKQLDARRLGWLVPGLLEEKITALIRSLPKSLRRNFVPAPDVARRIAAELPFGDGDMNTAVAAALTKYCGEKIRSEDFRDDALPQHLLMNIEVVDQRGKRLIAGRDIQSICKKMGVELHSGQVETIDHPDDAWRQDGLTEWTWKSLPEKLTLSRGGVNISAYPAVLDQGEAVGLRLLDSAAAAEAQSRSGLRRLFALKERKELKRQVQWLPRLDQLLMQAANLTDRDRWKQELALLIAQQALFPTGPGSAKTGLPRDQQTFAALCEQARRRIPAAVDEVARLTGPLFDSYHQARLALENAKNSLWSHSVADARAQLKELTAAGFLTNTPWPWLTHFPRYFQAITARLDKLKHGGLDRDQRALRELQPHLRACNKANRATPCVLIRNGSSIAG